MDSKIVIEELRKRNIDISDYNSTPASIFKKVYGNSKNFLTDHILGYGVISARDHIVFELSTGTGFSDNIIYGVSVTDGKTKFYDDSACLSDVTSLIHHILNLINKYL